MCNEKELELISCWSKIRGTNWFAALIFVDEEFVFFFEFLFFELLAENWFFEM